MGVKERTSLIPYLGISPDGAFELTVSSTRLNITGTRLEKGSRLPVAVYDQAQDSKDPDKAIAGLKAMQEFLNGDAIQDRGLVFGTSIAPKRRRK